MRFGDHIQDAPQSVGLLWTSGQLVAETSIYLTTTLTTDVPPVRFEPTISGTGRIMLLGDQYAQGELLVINLI